MKPAFFVGIALIILGVVALAYGGIPFTKQEKVDFGPFHATAEHQETFPLPKVLGVVSLVGGVLLVAVGSRK